MLDNEHLDEFVPCTLAKVDQILHVEEEEEL